MKLSIKVLSMAMLIMLAVSVIPAANSDSSGDTLTSLCRCEKFAKSNSISSIPVCDLDLAFCDPRSCDSKGDCCIDTFSKIFVKGAINKTVTPNPVEAEENATIRIVVCIPTDCLGIVQDFLPQGFEFVNDSLTVDGTPTTPIVIDGLVQVNNVQPGLHVITFNATAPDVEFVFKDCDIARVFFFCDCCITAFSQDKVLVTVLPDEDDENGDDATVTTTDTEVVTSTSTCPKVVTSTSTCPKKTCTR